MKKQTIAYIIQIVVSYIVGKSIDLAAAREYGELPSTIRVALIALSGVGIEYLNPMIERYIGHDEVDAEVLKDFIRNHAEDVIDQE